LKDTSCHRSRSKAPVDWKRTR